MARLARVVAPGFPHHITQRGNRRQQTFFRDEDYQSYLEVISEWCGAFEVEILAYCVMPNHLHLIAVPRSADGLRRAIGEVHRRYTRMVNFREGWRGHLWQGRFASCVLKDSQTAETRPQAKNAELRPVVPELVSELSMVSPEPATFTRCGSRQSESVNDPVVAVTDKRCVRSPWIFS